MSATLDLPDARWELVQLSGRVGAREPRRRPPRCVPVVSRSAAIAARRATSTTRSSPCAGRRPTEADGEAYGFSLVYSGNFLAEAEVDPFDTTRVRIGISPDTFAWTLEPGASFATPEAILVYSDAGLGAMSDALHGLYRERLARGTWRDRAAAGPRQQLGGDLLRLRRGQARRHRDRGTRPRRRAVRPRRRLVRRARQRRLVARRLVRRSAQAAERPRRRRREGRGAGPATSGCGSSPRWSASGAGSSPSIRTGRSGSPAGRGPRAGSSSCSTCRDRRSSTTCSASCPTSSSSAPISYVKWDMNRTITEPFSVALPPDRQGEFFHRYILGVYDLYRAAHDGASRTSCSSRAPAVAAGSTRGCSPSRRRPGRATTPTRSSACGSSGARRWRTR